MKQADNQPYMKGLAKILIHSEENFSSWLQQSAQKVQLTTFLNPYSYLIARKNPGLIEKFDYIFCDGISLVQQLRLSGLKLTRRSFDFTSLAGPLLEYAENHKKTIYLLGSTDEQVTSAKSKILKKHPQLQLAGYRHGYFENTKEYNQHLSKLKTLSPDIVIVGMGAPKQEKTLLDLAESGWKGHGITCGGFLHQTATAGTQYYPAIVNQLNLRWAYRIIDEPKLARRYAFDYPAAAIKIAQDQLEWAMTHKS